MNSFLKALLTIGILISFNHSACAEDATSAVNGLQAKEELTHEEKEAAEGVPTLQDEVERLKKLNPKQLAEEQKVLYDAMQNLTPKQRDELREEMLEELERMTPEERKALLDKAQTEEEKILAREEIEHSADPKNEAVTNTTKSNVSKSLQRK